MRFLARRNGRPSTALEPLYTPEAMRAFDDYASARGTPSIVLMENAGRGAADVLVRELLGHKPAGRRVVLVAGRGNNGGDAFVVARRLIVLGAHPELYCRVHVSALRGDALTNAEAYLGLGGEMALLDDAGMERLERSLRYAHAVVDGLFGTGLSRDVEGLDRDVIAAMASVRDKVLSLDVPSGLCARTGRVLGAAVRAGNTVTFVAEKLGTATAEGRAHAGTIHVVDIGVPTEPTGLPKEARRSASRLVASDFAADLPARTSTAHKYRAGHVLVIAGSPGKTGAALLAAHGAARAGAGATTLASFADTVPSLDARVLESMTTVIGDDVSLVTNALRGKHAIVLGPGLGRDRRAEGLVTKVLERAEVPVVLDADGFASLEGRLDALRSRTAPTILLPHEGELGRLLGISSEAVVADRFTRVREAALASGAVVLLKGACTMIAEAKGAAVEVTLVDSGVPALATAGSGDVLAGVVAALAAHLPARRSAELGAFLHGLAGAAWSAIHGDRGLLAREIADEIPARIRALRSPPG